MPADAEFQERLRNFTARITGSPMGLESLGGGAGDDAIEALAGDAPPELLQSTFEGVRTGADLAPEQAHALEAIILPRYRPALNVVDDTYDEPPWPWGHLGEDAYRDRIEAAIPSVGRVELPTRPWIPYGGTAFVVGPGLLMTNRHVAEIFARGLGRERLRYVTGDAEVDFKREVSSRKRIVVEVTGVEMIHPFWDMAVLRVEGLDDDQRPLTLSVQHPDDLAGADVAIIGYPAQDSRNDAQLQSQIFGGRFGIKRMQPGKLTGIRRAASFGNQVDAFTHDSSTLGGNSGSAVIDCTTGEIVGLHFAGRYLDANYAVPTSELARDSIVVDAGVNFGGRATGTPDPWAGSWQAADAEDTEASPAPASPSPAAPPAPAPAAGAPPATPAASAVSAGGGSVSLTVPLHLTLSLGEPAAGSAGATLVAGDEAAQISHPWGTDKLKITPDPDYDNRTGYDPRFLGSGDLEVKVPWLSAEQYQDVTFNGWDDDPKSRHLLAYHHYSLCLSKSRRLAWYTAGNIDGTKVVAMRRKWFDRDRWYYDPRIPRSAHVGNEAYKSNPLDRGHVLRRLDTVWGDDFGDAKKANDDTFHWTNCSPQHKTFNQGNDLWLGIESHLLDQAIAHDLKVSIFNGPVFEGDDPPYRDIRLPRAFWKIVAFVRDDGTLSASGYLLTQAELLTGDLKEGVEGVFDDWNGFQVPIVEIERMTGLSFRQLARHDAIGGDAESATPAGARPLRDFADLRL